MNTYRHEVVKHDSSTSSQQEFNKDYHKKKVKDCNIQLNGALFKSLNVGQVCNWQGILISDEKLQGMVTKLFNIHNLAKKLFFVTCCYL